MKSYVVKSMPTMGKSIFTTHDIPRDEIIFAEQPLLIIPHGMAMKVMVTPDSEYRLADYMKMEMLQQEWQLEVAIERMEPERSA